MHLNASARFHSRKSRNKTLQRTRTNRVGELGRSMDRDRGVSANPLPPTCHPARPPPPPPRRASRAKQNAAAGAEHWRAATANPCRDRVVEAEATKRVDPVAGAG